MWLCKCGSPARQIILIKRRMKDLHRTGCLEQFVPGQCLAGAGAAPQRRPVRSLDFTDKASDSATFDNAHY